MSNQDMPTPSRLTPDQIKQALHHALDSETCHDLVHRVMEWHKNVGSLSQTILNTVWPPLERALDIQSLTEQASPTPDDLTTLRTRLATAEGALRKADEIFDWIEGMSIDQPVVNMAGAGLKAVRAALASAGGETGETGHAGLKPDDTDDETYEIGKRDGQDEAVQRIDLLTGGDGEYFASTIPGRGCPDAPAMIAGIVERFNALNQALVDHNDLLRSAFQAAQRDAIHDVAGTTNYRTLADRAGEVLAKHHAATNAARDAVSEPDPAPSEPTTEQREGK